ncbi:hypothetical protein MASR2M18_04240 [Ignavibacteria bacterium]|jgi:5-methyltetrahydrofolate--homocysteine methyltransferase|nr:hypothetical protein [Bacteroidota bacterium]MCZ2133791.1 hypothetical protein [Bacteroidota bacterium]
MNEQKYTPPEPNISGIHNVGVIPLEILREYIDWTPFFLSWEMRGKYPAIFESPAYGDEARKLFDETNEILDKIIADGSLTAEAVCGFFPANSIGNDDIEIYADETRSQTIFTLNMLRQQTKRGQKLPNLCLADFIAPKESGIRDYIGAFAVTSGIGTVEICREYEAKRDDYSAILTKAIADRLAEAAAEWLHERVRREFWGYAAAETLSNEDRIAENYRGIRPAPGYPACPDHTEKKKLFALLEAQERIRITLTENYAMMPAASVSGWYFSHPKSQYFSIGKITREQLADYARRKSWTDEEAERWLGANLE